MKKFVSIAVLLLIGLQGAGPAAEQQDLGVPANDGVVVCTSAPACDAGASVMMKASIVAMLG